MAIRPPSVGIGMADCSNHKTEYISQRGSKGNRISQMVSGYDGDGTTYIVRIYGRERPDGTWEGWLEFHPTENHKSVLRTEQETSQPNRTAVEYWASGLEPIYLEGAFARAQGRLP
jgi:hypothetical protein